MLAMLFNGKCKVFAPFYYIPMEIENQILSSREFQH